MAIKVSVTGEGPMSKKAIDEILSTIRKKLEEKSTDESTDESTDDPLLNFLNKIDKKINKEISKTKKEKIDKLFRSFLEDVIK